MHEEIAFPSRKTMARLFDCAESTIDDLVRRGVIPRPLKLSNGCVRWDWAAVRAAMVGMQRAAHDAGTPDNLDPYLVGARNATKGSSDAA